MYRTHIFRLVYQNKTMVPRAEMLLLYYFVACYKMFYFCYKRKVQVGNDQEKAQSERDSTPKTEVGKTRLTIKNLYHENTS